MSRVSSFYLRHTQISVEEDDLHEFKGHRTLSVQEIGCYAAYHCEDGKPSRQPISRTICGFLNAGRGGTIYIGVIDTGVIHGICLTQEQKDHMEITLGDLLAKYTPPVAKGQVSMSFIPVLDSNQQTNSYVNPDPIQTVKGKDKHRLRTWRYCWCDTHSRELLRHGILIGNYVVEINVEPWCAFSERSKLLNPLVQIPQQVWYEDETGMCYYRIGSSIISMVPDELENVTRIQTHEYRGKLVERIGKVKEEIKEVREGRWRDDEGFVEGEQAMHRLKQVAIGTNNILKRFLQEDNNGEVPARSSHSSLLASMLKSLTHKPNIVCDMKC